MTSILDVVGGHLRRVKRSGNENVMAICPFHTKSDGTEEKDPSFAMNIYSGLWYCHSCHARGNLYAFFRSIGFSRAQIELQFAHALAEAEEYAPPKPHVVEVLEQDYEPLPESFLGLFDACPQPLIDEGFSEEVLQLHDVGFDEKHKRITFPLRDWRGRLVGINGRSVDGSKPRYKVYDKEYEAFGLPFRRTEKRAVLWNVHRVLIASTFDTDSRFTIIVEGFKATMRLVQGGIRDVCAVLGSYMSFDQQRLIERLPGAILLMFDNNDAGQRGQLDAARRLIPHLAADRLFAVEYEGDQPSDLSPSDVPNAVLGAVSLSSWLMKKNRQTN